MNTTVNGQEVELPEDPLDYKQVLQYTGARLIKQGGMATHPSFDCGYRGMAEDDDNEGLKPTGDCCPIGWLIPDHFYDNEMEGTTFNNPSPHLDVVVAGVLRDESAEVDDLTAEQLEFFGALQDIHDNFNNRTAEVDDDVSWYKYIVHAYEDLAKEMKVQIVLPPEPDEITMDLTTRQVYTRVSDHGVHEEGEVYTVIECAFCEQQSRVPEGDSDAVGHFQHNGWRYASSKHWQMTGAACLDCAKKIRTGKPEEITENRSRGDDIDL